MGLRHFIRRSCFGVQLPLVLACLVIGAAPARAVDIGDVPPDYLGKSVDKTRIYLSESNGKIRIITFWATWCAPCLKELPVLNAVQKRGGADRIQVIAVNINDRKNDFRRALRKLDDYEIDFVYDYKHAVADKYDVEGIPHMLIVDVDGRVAFQHVGYNESALTGIVEEINSLLIKNNLLNSEPET